jgi:hypothetical protein
MNKDRQKRQILRFLSKKYTAQVDVFTIYQWIDRCYFEQWRELAVALGALLPPNSLTDQYHKRVEYMLSECRKINPDGASEQSGSLGSCKPWTQELHYHEELSCEHCRFSVMELREMAELGGRKEKFYTFGGRRRMNIYKVDSENGYITMRRSTEKFTSELSLNTLIRVHNSVHSGDVDLDAHEIDNLRINGRKVVHMWGNYIAGLLKHLGCRKIGEKNEDKSKSTKFYLPDNLRGRSIHDNVIPTVCNLKNMLAKLRALHGNVAFLKPWEKRSYDAYRIDEIKVKILNSPEEDWKEIIRSHILQGDPSDFGASCMDIYLVAYVTETFDAEKKRFFQYIKENGISEKDNTAQAIWQVGKGDGIFLNILNDDGTIKDLEFIKKWING